MEDSVAILNLVNRADRLATKRDVAAYCQLFARDGQIVGEKGTAKGRAEIATLVTRTWRQEAEHTYHLTANVEISQLTAQTAEVVSTLCLIAEKQLVQLTEINHRLQKQNGNWYFTERKINE